MKSYERILFLALATLIIFSSVTNLNVAAGSTSKLAQPNKPIALQVIDPASNAIPNGDFENSTTCTSNATLYPYGWTTENHGGLVNSRNVANDSYEGSRCWEMSTEGNGYKNIWYHFNATGAPNTLTFAVKLAQGHSGNDIIQVKIKDLTQSVGVDVELIYEFGNSNQQVMPSNTYQKVIHEQANYSVWYYRVKQWKTDWLNAYGSQPNMNDRWAILLGLNTYNYVSDTMIARYDAISMETSPGSDVIPNGGFENATTNGAVYPYGWTTENHYGLVDARNIASDSYQGSRCWEMSTSGYGWKNIWYYLNGTGAPDTCAFGVKLAQGQSDNDIIQVKVKDLTQSVGVDVELIYEFSHGSQQVWVNNINQKSIHEQVNYSIWYYRVKQWKTDWLNMFGSQPNMNDNWALLLGLDTGNYASDVMIARYDAISMGNSIPSGAPNLLPNAGFEDTRMIGNGSSSYPVGGWTGSAKYPNDNAPGFSADSYQGNWSWEQSLQGTNDSWKWIGYDFTSGNLPSFIAFAIKEVSGANGNNLIEVWLEDHSQNPVQRMCYEFSTNPTQVRGDGWDGYAYSYVYHEKINLNTWYYNIKNWKADWQNKLGYAPNMSHFWRIVLSIDSFHVASPTVARYDSIWIGDLGGGTGGGAGSGSGNLGVVAALILVPAIGLVMVLLVAGVARRISHKTDREGQQVLPVGEAAASQPNVTEKGLIGPATQQPSCPNCGAPIKHSAAMYCWRCGASLTSA